ncbi:MAG: DUF6588 family protein [Bacteroidales bacterium]
MSKPTTRRVAVMIVTSFLISSAAFSQFSNVDFLRSSPADAVKFVQAYITPWANAFGAGLNGSWYNTAKPHKFGGFDITTSLNVGIVPESAGTFDISSIGLSPALSGTGKAPTVSGAKTDGPQITYKSGTYTLATFKTPPGTNWKYIPVPMLQVGLGLPLGTELKARYLPKIPIKGGDVSMWGVGIMHSIMQYIPGHKLLPFDASLFAGYERLTGNVPISLQPETGTGIIENYTTINPATYFSDQNLNAMIEALNISAIGSVNLKVITFYAGLGYSKTKTSIKLEGHYPSPVPVATPSPHVEYNDVTGSKSILTGTDFPTMNIANFSGLRANAGFRLKLAVITIHFDYTRAQYNVVSAGLGISFR